jgi:hypothetical protein
MVTISSTVFLFSLWNCSATGGTSLLYCSAPVTLIGLNGNQDRVLTGKIEAPILNISLTC